MLINNAGIYADSSLVSSELDEYRRVIEVNQIGVYLGMREVAPVMMERGGGSIINNLLDRRDARRGVARSPTPRASGRCEA